MGLNETIKNLKRTITFEPKIKSKLGTIELDVVSRKIITITNTSTNRRTEAGFNIADNSKLDPILIDITVVDNSDKYDQNRKDLNDMAKNGKVTTFYYSNKDKEDNVKIEKFAETEQSSQREGYTYDITLKVIRTAQLSENDWVINEKPISENAKNTHADANNPTEQQEKSWQSTLDKMNQASKKK